MNHEQDRSHARGPAPAATNARDHDVPGKISVAAALGKQDRTEASGLVPAFTLPAPDPLFVGHLDRMRREGEFRQLDGKKEQTLYRACLEALRILLAKDPKLARKEWGITLRTLEAKAMSFRDIACNIMTLFFIEHAVALRLLDKSLSYDEYKQQIEKSMKDYFSEALLHKRINGEWDMEDSRPLDQKQGCDEHHSPSQKAEGLLRCEGKLLRIHTAKHFFLGRVEGGLLYAHDNQSDDRKRSGVFNLRKAGPGTETYKYLRYTLLSASPERTPNSGQCEDPAGFLPASSE